jgi:phosphatidylinositol-3-phosphatase
VHALGRARYGPPMPRAPRAPSIVAALLLTAAVACTDGSPSTSASASVAASSATTPSSTKPPASPTTTAPSRTTAPLVVIFMENHERSHIVASPSAPFHNSMLRRGRDYTNYFAVTHPSLPNYLAFASGSTAGKTDDEISAGEVATSPTLWDQLSAADVDWAVYEEGMPEPCFDGASAGSAPGDYALKHNPATPFHSVFDDASDCSRVVPLSALDPSHLPAFSFITPNECNDGHSCALDTADAWLAQHVPPLVDAGADVIVTYDEGTTGRGAGGSAGGGQVFAAEVGPGVRAGTVVAKQLNHYSLLAGIEERFGVGRLGEAAHATAMPT